MITYWVKTFQLCDEGVCSDNVKGADTENLVGVVLAGLLEDLSSNGDSAVHGVGDDGNDGIRADLSSSLKKIWTRIRIKSQSNSSTMVG